MKKILTIVLALTMILALAACGSTASPAAETTSTLDTVLSSGKLRVAIIPDNPGWSVLGSDNEYTGYDADIARSLADALGVKLEFVNTDAFSFSFTACRLASNPILWS